MSRNLIWKFALILAVVVVCVLEVYPPKKRLKPGIDLAGGTSLLYQIDTTGLTDQEKRTIAADMIRVLRQRIDPDNQRNLVWRAHGNDRIEIQMPLATQETRELRQTYVDLRDELKQYNLDLRAVREALVQPAGMEKTQYLQWRQARFEELAGGDAERLAMLESLAQANDARQVAEVALEAALTAQETARSAVEAAGLRESAVLGLYGRWEQMDDPNRVAAVERIAGDNEETRTVVRSYIEAKQKFEQVREQLWAPEEGLKAKEEQAWRAIEDLNFDLDKFEQVVSSRAREEELAKMKGAYPELTETIDQTVKAYDAYAKVAGRLDNPEDLKRLLRGSGVLEFRIAPMPGELSAGEIERYVEDIKEYGPTKASDERYVWRPMRDPAEFRQDAIRATFAGEEYVLLSNQVDETMLHSMGEEAWRLQNARPGTDSYGRWAVDFVMNELGTKRFFDLTKENRSRPLCILLDDEAISAPNIQSAILRRGQITGDFSLQEVQDLVDKLNAGSLPARLSDQPISENTIGPLLGKDNLDAGLKAGIYGLIAVAVFMLIYYWFAGALADVALFMNLLLITGVMALSRATFTMPGIAGLILTIGMAVDANVLVFERIREEQQRGSSLRMAIKNGYGRALRTIMDANITTFVTALILYLVASEEVKGFALTLMIGIVSSMFTALFVTRAIFDLCTDRRWIKEHLRMFQAIKNASINWMGKRPVFWLISGSMVVGGWVIFSARDEQKNSKYSIEFTGGTSIHVLIDAAEADQLLTPDERAAGKVLREKVEELIRAEGAKMGNPLIEAAQVQRIGRENADRVEFEIVTTETNRLEVRLTGEADVVTAAALQQAVRDAAQKLGDRRLASATVIDGEQPGMWLLDTQQANRNQVREGLNRAFLALSPVEVADVTEGDEETVKASLVTRAGRQVDLAAVQAAVEETMNAIHVVGLGTPEAVAGQAQGQFVIQAKGQVASMQRVAQEVAARLAPVQEAAMETNEVVTRAIRDALEGYLDELESLQPGNVEAKPITDELLSQKPYLAQYRGGLWLSATFGQEQQATLAQLKDRFEQARLRAGFEQYGDYERVVLAPGDQSQSDQTLQGVEMAVVAGDIVYGASSDEEWSTFVSQERERFTETLAWQTSLPRVTQIDPSVGAQARNRAYVAVVFSLLAIILYVWLRFGNVRFGLAAVVALVHDVSIAMGLVAASAWLAQTSVGRALGISDFKIDLPMIAGFLTVIGYSLNDTIVVFDRIRENRGKLATLSTKVINNSINQTLSRTLLTSLTTLLVLLVMYIWGGSALRGFNYVLIIGVVVGTYSSIAIASPLLIGAKTERALGGTGQGSAKS